MLAKEDTGIQIQCLQDNKITHTLIVIYDNIVVCYYNDKL